MNQIVFAVVVTSHSGQRFPINAFFINAQPAPSRLILKNLMRQLVDAGTRLARAGVAGDKPAATELIPPPNEPTEFGNVGFATWF